MITPAEYVKKRYQDAPDWTDEEEVRHRHKLCVDLTTKYGLSSPAIGKLLNMHDSSVRHALAKFGFSRKQGKRISDETTDKIQRLTSRGVKIQIVAEMCDVSVPTVRRYSV
jgi:transposase